MKLSSQISSFLEYLESEKNASQKTIQNYDHYLRRFLLYAGDIDPSAVDIEQVNAYRSYLSRFEDPETGHSLKLVTQNYFLIALRAFLRFLKRNNINTLSAENVQLQDATLSPIKVLETGSLQKLLQAPDIHTQDGLRDKAILEILFATGLRVSELASLNIENVDLLQKELTVVGKAEKRRVLSLSEISASWLDRYLMTRHDNFSPLFIRYQGKVEVDNAGEKMRLSVRSIERTVEKYVKAIGLTSKATPHTLRHSFALNLVTTGSDLDKVKEVLGHANLSTTQMYNQLKDRKKDKKQ